MKGLDWIESIRYWGGYVGYRSPAVCGHTRLVSDAGSARLGIGGLGRAISVAAVAVAEVAVAVVVVVRYLPESGLKTIKTHSAYELF
jgi:hypothetical protein